MKESLTEASVPKWGKCWLFGINIVKLLTIVKSSLLTPKISDGGP